MTARLRTLAAGWLLTFTLTVLGPDPDGRGGEGVVIVAPTSLHATARWTPGGAAGRQRSPESLIDGAQVAPEGPPGVRVSLRVAYEQQALLPEGEAHG